MESSHDSPQGGARCPTAPAQFSPKFDASEVAVDDLSAGRFAELVGARFQIVAETGIEMGLELVSLTTMSPKEEQSGSRANPKFESFSLLFNGPAERPLRQGTYRFRQERLGAFDLFIVPVSAVGNARQYEAVFNRRIHPRAPEANRKM